MKTGSSNSQYIHIHETSHFLISSYFVLLFRLYQQFLELVKMSHLLLGI